MKIRELMTKPVIRINPEESVAVAARTLTHYNIGILPVCGGNGKLCGLVTDRDLVIRCLASAKNPERTPVRDVMTKQLYCIGPDMEAEEAARLMGKIQVRRLPVLENGRLCGMVSLGDLSDVPEAERILRKMSKNLSEKDECAPVEIDKKDSTFL